MIHFTGNSFTPAHFREMMHKFADGVHNKDYVKLSYLDYRYLRDQYHTYLEQDNEKFRVLAVYGSRIGTCRAEIIIIAPDASNPDGWVMVQSDDCSLGSWLWDYICLTCPSDSPYISQSEYNNLVQYIINKYHDSDIMSYKDYCNFLPKQYHIDENHTFTTETNKKNEKENIFMNFNFDFGPCGDTVKLSMYGIAVKNANGTYVSYDRKNGQIIDVDILNFEGGKYCYKIPVSIDSIAVGDTIIHAKKPMFVVGKNDSNLVVVDVVAGEEKSIIPTRNMFGFDYATKVVSVIDSFGGLSANKDNPFGNMLPLLLLGDNKSGNTSDMLLPLMLMGGNGAVDFTKNPMMLYLLMNDKSKSIDPLMLMALTGNLNFGANPQTAKK
jgi:hypothetical protein